MVYNWFQVDLIKTLTNHIKQKIRGTMINLQKKNILFKTQYLHGNRNTKNNVYINLQVPGERQQAV